jgi:hypothetical protein
MKLIDRYLYAIGQRLPAEQRKDILIELRSELEDALEDRVDGRPTEADEAAIIEAMGPPRKVAAAYYPERQYLIGPELYPLFKTVVGIVFTAVIGAQLLVVLLSFTLTGEAVAWIDSFWEILNGLPTALGFVVLLFIALERLEINPQIEEKAFDPRQLPPVNHDEQVSRGEKVFSIIFSVIFLVILARFAQQGGFAWVNPIIEQYVPWVALSMIATIALDIVLLWRGRWQLSTRVATIAANLFSLVVLSFLIQGHTAWLVEAGITGLAQGLILTPEMFAGGYPMIGIVASFRIGFVVTAVIIAVDTAVSLYRLVRVVMRGNDVAQMDLNSAILSE